MGGGYYAALVSAELHAKYEKFVFAKQHDNARTCPFCEALMLGDPLNPGMTCKDCGKQVREREPRQAGRRRGACWRVRAVQRSWWFDRLIALSWAAAVWCGVVVWSMYGTVLLPALERPPRHDMHRVRRQDARG